MTRGKQDRLYRSFNKGLITEAGFLTYPEDASIDELNTIIYRKGNRSRRPGIDYEEFSQPTNFNTTVGANYVTEEFFWKTPGAIPNLNFLVVQVGTILHFFDATVAPLSSGQKSFTVSLDEFKAPTATFEQVGQFRVQMSSGKGYLFVAQEYIDPFFVTYDQDTDDVTATRIYIQMRDFDGVNDGLPNDAEPSTLSVEHHYNLLNQGWAEPGTPTNPTPSGGSGGSSGVYYNPWEGSLLNRPDIP